ncbi:MAG: amidohydrolase [Anaerolineaceae bacterium]|nr:amidohydrolase [Anaerolineaceae bacterium]
MSVVERILYNGKIWTQSPASPRVSALALIGERIVASGTDAEMLALAGPNTIRENLDGGQVIPGLTDAHVHWAMTSCSLQEVNVFELPSKEEALDRVAERVRSSAAGEWITGYGWSQDFWPEPHFPAAADLDRVAQENPVYLDAKSGHAAWVNSAALRLCGLNADTRDPEGGYIGRDDAGQPNGMLFETAMDLVSERIPRPDPEQLASLMATAQQRALAAGLTGLHDFDGPDCLQALQILRERGELALRVTKQINCEWIDHALKSGLRSGFGDDWLRIGAQKIFADGALGPRTALMLAPYDDDPENLGVAVVEREEMQALVSRASAAGFASTIHAIGDRAVHDVLDVFETARLEEASRGQDPADLRHRIEHVQLIHPQDIARLKSLGLVASMQPLHATSDYLAAEWGWGDRVKWSYNIRAQLDLGARVALGSDSPVEPIEPLKSLYAAITRRRPDGSPGPEGWLPELRLTPAETMQGFTIGPAWATHMDDRLGRLAPGYLADLVLLDRDPLECDPEELPETQVLGTMVGGIWRYRAP